TITIENLAADCGVLRKAKAGSSPGRFSYEPVSFTGTQSIEKEDKLALMVAGVLLERIQNKWPERGMIASIDKKTCAIKLDKCHKIITPILEQLQEWAHSLSPEPPPLILNRHCPYCQFQNLCTAKAEQDDNLSLLDGISTPKAIRQYEKRGIFTVKQLSYLFKPKKKRKDAKRSSLATHKVELQALAIRTGQIYLQEVPVISRQPVELFLDIEGVPDRQEHYLIGLLVYDGETSSHHSFWADTHESEALIWHQFLEKVKQYPNAPIYHYGSYEPRAI